MTTTLSFGWNSALPDNVESAWGARLIINMDGLVDFVPGRSDHFGDDNFLDLLQDRFPKQAMETRIRDGLFSGEFTTRTDIDVVLYDDDDIAVVANPNGSAGYLYVSAWRKP
jgi:hypothetical protein